MKIKRLKSYRRIIDAYSKHFDLKTDPLEIFVDSTFANQALLNKRLNIQEQFDCTLSVPFKLVTSTCVIRECEQLGSVFQGALNILSNYRLLPCRHKFDPSKGAPWCVKKRIALVRRSKRANVIDKNVTFALASNDEALQARARLVFGMPVFYIAHNRINLEQFPPEVLEFIQTKAHNAPKVSQHEVYILCFMMAHVMDNQRQFVEPPLHLGLRIISP